MQVAAAAPAADLPGVWAARRLSTWPRDDHRDGIRILQLIRCLLLLSLARPTALARTVAAMQVRTRARGARATTHPLIEASNVDCVCCSDALICCLMDASSIRF
ncbi:hypothetical protein GUITHDRAFT_151349 [Guillardia theta CCMP2712]|uniref:Uncharacterized protein n=1 Tax=Guillardia theta (strain CCMP2712) TaxID=905079 RepID=L1JNW4_GUITC|nr:hypothetical protein GUITHDRAFT_151349 [Guillardia theta CCMP2712]EKX49974.1 hypothetical protein GUITHDRAFT_151349 [Guillardia theta CCMP2712]|eukprot:XP_005836954.1 hypothetical protein GUITHDRAFT_151349 [Guillardia theta CCMP2712]